MGNLRDTNLTGQQCKSRAEDLIQASIVEDFRNKYCLEHHNPRYCVFSVPNGGTRNKIEAMTLKATGLLAGVSDLIFIIDKVYFVELKTEIGTQSDKQKEFEQTVTNLGQEYIIIRSFNEYEQWLKKILNEQLNILLTK